MAKLPKRISYTPVNIKSTGTEMALSRVTRNPIRKRITTTFSSQVKSLNKHPSLLDFHDPTSSGFSADPARSSPTLPVSPALSGAHRTAPMLHPSHSLLQNAAPGPQHLHMKCSKHNSSFCLPTGATLPLRPLLISIYPKMETWESWETFHLPYYLHSVTLPAV